MKLLALRFRPKRRDDFGRLAGASRAATETAAYGRRSVPTLLASSGPIGDAEEDDWIGVISPTREIGSEGDC